MRLASLLLASTLSAASAGAAEPLRIAVVEAMSGPFANIGEGALHHAQFAAKAINARGDVHGGSPIEVFGVDSKGTPDGAITAYASALEKGARYVMQGNSSAVGAALIDAVNKTATRTPEKAALFLNYGSQDPAFNNEKCSFWHFRFEANSDMRTEALTTFIADDKKVKKIYLLNQDYQFGQQVSKAAREYLARKRPDIAIAGDDFVPIGRVKDFAPYAAKIKASAADTLLTSNFGNDLSLFVKALREAGFDGAVYTYFSGGFGAPTQIGAAGENRMRLISNWHPNAMPGTAAEQYAVDYKRTYNEEMFWITIKYSLEMLDQATRKAKSIEPAQVARALEGMKYKSDIGEVEMRAVDHQAINPMFVSTFVKAGGKDARYDLEGTGFGFRTDRRLEPWVSAQPTSCKMTRP